MEILEIFSIIGTISFSVQGGLIAIESKYDLFAVYVFGMITAFGGGVLRHVIMGESDYNLWNQTELYWVAFISITLILLMPNFFVKSEGWWSGVLDAIGVIAFAIQGAVSALNMNLPTSAVVVATLITATGGGVLRDLLSQRKPVLLVENIYTLWIFLIGLIIGLFRITSIVQLLIIYFVFTGLRLLSYFYKWIIPYRHY